MIEELKGKMSRREFVLGAGACGALWTLPMGGCVAGRVGRAYPGWQPGEMDIHFIHTGVGEQTFFIFPDGTTMLLDCGYVAKRRPGYAEAIPPQPSGRLRGGEWVARYLACVTDRREIDYVMVSHWHDDHVMGLPDVAKVFSFRNWTDHQFPGVGLHNRDADPDALRLAREFIPDLRAKGMKASPFAVGARGQFELLNDRASRRYGDFEIRNLAANCVLWDGGDGSVDYAKAHVAAIGKDQIMENQLSAAMRIRYGAFTYYTGGDVELELKGADGKAFDWEQKVGAASGPVDVCKTNHHAFWNAMHAPFVREIRACAYLSSTWSPNQVNDRNLPIIASRDLYPGDRMIYHGFMPIGKREELAGKPYLADFSPAQGHQVVKVAPGGRTYEIYTLSAADESMTILDCRAYASRG